MIQNSLPRLLEGMADALRDVVAPALEDPFARSQAQASAELLRNLAPRVEWRCDDLAAVVADVREVLAAADGAGPEGVAELAAARSLLDRAPPDRADNAALVDARRDHLAALAGVQAWLAGAEGHDALREQVRDVVRRQLAGELERLRTAAGRP